MPPSCRGGRGSPAYILVHVSISQKLQQALAPSVVRFLHLFLRGRLVIYNSSRVHFAYECSARLGVQTIVSQFLADNYAGLLFASKICMYVCAYSTQFNSECFLLCHIKFVMRPSLVVTSRTIYRKMAHGRRSCWARRWHSAMPCASRALLPKSSTAGLQVRCTLHYCMTQGIS